MWIIFSSALILGFLPVYLRAEPIPPPMCEYETSHRRCMDDCDCVWCTSKDSPKCMDHFDIKQGLKHCSNYTRGDDCKHIEEVNKWIIYVYLSIVGGLFALFVVGLAIAVMIL